jgi:gliding motility-associated-like protein
VKTEQFLVTLQLSLLIKYSMKILLLNTRCHLRLFVLNLFIISSFVVKAQPVANFSATPTSGCTPLAVSFTDQSTGSPTSWAWDLGNGTTSTQQNPTTTYFNSGLFTISLTVTNASGSNTLIRTQYIKVDDKPVVDFTASNRSGCFPLRASFNDLSTGGSAAATGWEWDFGDGGLSTAQNPFHIYTTAGNYTVTLKVTNSGGCSKTVSRPNYIQVSPGVTVNFSNSIPQLCKPPETINFTDASTGPGVLSYEWLFGDGGTAFVANPSHTYNTGGSFNVSLIVQSSQGCIDTLVKPAVFVIKNVVSNFTSPATICKGVTATFTNTSTPASISSLWDFGDLTSSALSNPTKVYATPGLYNVRLINNYGTCSDSVIKPITVLPLPTPNFTAPDVTDCKVPFTVNFSDASTGATGWSWNFGDGGTSNAQNPSHTYTTLGNYTVTLVATGANGCKDSVIKNQFVRIQKPIVGMNSFPQEGCIPYTINPTPNVTAVDGVSSYLWDFGDGFTSAAQNPTHTYTIQGNYTVKLVITTNDGCKDSSVLVNAVVVGNKSPANFSASPLAQCVSQNIQFTNLTVPSDRWRWDFGDGVGISNTQNPLYAYQDTGKFSIRLIAWNNGCADTLIKASYITILPPIAKFTSSYNCTNKLQVAFTDQSVLPQTWSWDFGDGFTSNLPNPVHIYSAYGTYYVTLTVTNGSCSHTKGNSVVLFNETPDFSAANGTICTSELATFVATGVNPANISTYFWDYGDGISGFAGSTTTHNYLLPGLYTVTLTVTDIKGCPSTVVKTNIIRVWGPKANFSFTPLAGCRPLNVTFTDLTVTDGVHPVTKWEWDFGDGKTQIYTVPPFTHTYDTIGNINPRLLVTDSYGCIDITYGSAAVFITKPKAIFSTSDSLTCVGKNVVFTNTSTGVGLSYVWNFGDLTSSTAANPTKIYAADGDYAVKLVVTDVNGCKDSTTKPNYIKVHTVKAAFTVNDSISSCSPFEVVFTNTSLYSSSVKWFFGDGTSSTLPQPTHYYNTPGTYIAKIVVTGPGGCTDSITKTIILYDSTATLTYAPLSGCSPLTVRFHASTPGPVTYLWDLNDGSTVKTTDSNLVYNYLLGGNFLPKVILEDQTGCQIPVTGVDTIFVTRSFVEFGASDSVFCDSGTVNFTDSTIATNGLINGYLWSFGDGGTSAIKNPSHTYAAPGLYTVRLIVTTNNGCSDTLIKNNYIKVVASPVVDFTGTIPICLQQKPVFNGIVVVPDTSALKWFWNFGNGNTSTSQNPLPQRYDTAGSYNMRLIVTNSTGCADTVDRIVVIYPLPVINAGPDTILIVGSSVAINPTGSPVVDYLWTPSTSLTCTNCYNTVADPKNTTTYSIRVTDANGCVNKDEITIIVVCNDKNVFIPNTFSPNGDGNNDQFYPRGKGLFAIQSMRIFNRWGEMVFQKNNLFPNDPTAGWNGRYNGRLANPDVYTYIIEIVCENSQIITYKGNIALLL